MTHYRFLSICLVVGLTAITNPCQAKSLNDWLSITPSYESALADIQAHNYGHALDTLTQLQAKHPNNPRYLYDLALIHHQLGNTTQANQLSSQLQQQFPNSIEAQTIATALHVSQGMAGNTPTEQQQTVSLPAVQAGASYSALPSQPIKDDISHLLRTLDSTTVKPSRAQSSSNIISAQTPAPSAPEPDTVTSPTVDQAAQMQQMMNQMMLMNMMSGGMGNLGGGSQNQNPMTMMMLPMMMQQMGGNGLPNSPNAASPYGQMDPETLSTMMMNQVMGSMDFSSGTNKDNY